MNAAVLAYGLTVGGREGAKNALMSFWRRIAHAAMFSPLQPSLYDRMTHNYGLDNTHYWIDPAQRVTGVIMTQVLPFSRLLKNGNAGRAITYFYRVTAEVSYFSFGTAA
jgi:hypothetical protein